jgi:hypothetical protein
MNLHLEILNVFSTPKLILYDRACSEHIIFSKYILPSFKAPIYFKLYIFESTDLSNIYFHLQ